MQRRATLQLVATDPNVFEDAAQVLGAANYRLVSADPTRHTAPDLIILHAGDLTASADGVSTPVLTLDLAMFCGADLVRVIERVTGRPDIRFLAQA
jgi:hypothetical protein